MDYNLRAVMRKLAEARIHENRFDLIESRLELAAGYVKGGFREAAAKHLEIVANENAYWKAEVEKLNSYNFQVFTFSDKWNNCGRLF